MTADDNARVTLTGAERKNLLDAADGLLDRNLISAVEDLMGQYVARERAKALRAAAAYLSDEDEAINVALRGVDYVVGVLRDRADHCSPRKEIS